MQTTLAVATLGGHIDDTQTNIVNIYFCFF